MLVRASFWPRAGGHVLFSEKNVRVTLNNNKGVWV